MSTLLVQYFLKNRHKKAPLERGAWVYGKLIERGFVAKIKNPRTYAVGS